jgi:hypothetical protein
MDVALVVGDRRRHSCGDGPGRVSGMGSRDPCARPPARARGSRSGHHGGRGDRGPAPSRHRRRVRGPGCGRAGCRPWISHPHAAVAAGPDLPSGAPAGLGLFVVLATRHRTSPKAPRPRYQWQKPASVERTQLYRRFHDEGHATSNRRPSTLDSSPRAPSSGPAHCIRRASPEHQLRNAARRARHLSHERFSSYIFGTRLSQHGTPSSDRWMRLEPWRHS